MKWTSHFRTILTCTILNHKKLRLLRFIAPEYMLKKGQDLIKEKNRKFIKIHISSTVFIAVLIKNSQSEDWQEYSVYLRTEIV